MTTLFKWCNVLYWLALVAWVSSLASAGIAAGGVFSTLPKLGMAIERFRPALGDNAAEHGRLAGGMVMEPIFAITDIVQVVAAALVLVTCILQLFAFGMNWNRMANLLRLMCIIVAASLVAYHTMTVAPRMNRELRQFWTTAEQNDVQAMASHRAAFDADHVVANRLFMFRFGLLVLAVVASAAAFSNLPAKPRPLS